MSRPRLRAAVHAVVALRTGADPAVDTSQYRTDLVADAAAAALVAAVASIIARMGSRIGRWGGSWIGCSRKGCGRGRRALRG